MVVNNCIRILGCPLINLSDKYSRTLRDVFLNLLAYVLREEEMLERVDLLTFYL